MSGDHSESRVSRTLTDVGEFAAENPRVIFAAVVAVALLASGIAATSLQMSMGMTLYIEDDSTAAQNWDELKSDFDEGNNVFVMVESDQLTDPETIRAIDRLDRRYTGIDEVGSVTSLADIVRMGNNGTLPQSEHGVEQAIARVEAQGPGARAMVENVRPESGTTILLAPYGNVDTFDRGRFLPRRGSDIIYSEFRSETAYTPLPPGLEVTITGQPVFENAAFGLMLPEMITLFAGAFTLIFLVVYLVMRGKLVHGWHVFLPLGTAMLALLYMMGVMGILGYNFNAIMLGVMPIALGLGIDYGLQVQTRYVEERDAGRDPVTAAGIVTRTTGRALLIAMGTTVVGLGSLLVSAVPPVRQFGVASASSVLAAMALSITLLPALLVWFDDHDETAVARDGVGSDPDRLESVMRVLTGQVIGRKPIVALVLAVLLVSGGAAAYPQVEPKQEMMDFWPQNLDEKRDMETLSDTVESPKVVYVIVETDQAYTPETFRDVADYQRLMLDNPNVNTAMSPISVVQTANGGDIPTSQSRLESLLTRYQGQGPMAIQDPSTNPSKLRIAFYIDDIEGEPVRTLIDEFEGNAELAMPNAEVLVTGKPVLNRNVIENVTAGLTPMTLLSFTLGFAFLALAFRSVRVAGVLIVSVAASATLLVAGSMYVLGIPWNPLTVTMSSIALGVGIDYGVHVYERFEEEVVERGRSATDAVVTSVAKLSRPILGSSLTTIFGFGVLLISRFPVLSNFGWTTVLAISLSLLVAFTILPATLMTVTTVEDGERKVV